MIVFQEMNSQEYFEKKLRINSVSIILTIVENSIKFNICPSYRHIYFVFLSIVQVKAPEFLTISQRLHIIYP